MIKCTVKEISTNPIMDAGWIMNITGFFNYFENKKLFSKLLQRGLTIDRGFHGDEKLLDIVDFFLNRSKAFVETGAFAAITTPTEKQHFLGMVLAPDSLLPGGNVDTVTNALGFDTRIGLRYLKGGLEH